MIYTYPAIIHEGENGGYWAEFVDFDAFTQGDTLKELVANAKEAMACHIEDELRNGAALPKPSEINDVRTADGLVSLIRADIYAPSRPMAFAGAVAMA